MGEDSETPRWTSDDLVATLCGWVYLGLKPQRLKERAKAWRFRAWTPNARRRLHDEVAAFEIWVVMHVSGRLLDDKEKLHAIWDRMFLRLHPDVGRSDLAAWKTAMLQRGERYNNALEIEHPSGPLWVVAKALNESLFGQLKKDAEVQLHMITDMSLGIAVLEEYLLKGRVDDPSFAARIKKEFDA